jgi:tripartite-type tricarboxylate transporter receptor subunit TctC
LPYLLNEHFRPLGITSARRFALLPELPTLAESGLPGFEVVGWYGIFAPARSPSAAMVWLNQRIAAMTDDPSTADRLLALGLEASRVSREQFATRIHSEVELWGPLVRASRLPYRGRAS